jgi:imidazolonepropionase-like amidohydrolase
MERPISYGLQARMMIRIARAGTAFIICIAAVTLYVQAFRYSDNAIVFNHVAIIDGTGAPATFDMTLVIEGNKIVALGKAGTIRFPKAAHIVDGAGKFLIPGLWDMHVHTGSETYLALFVANGITGVRDMGGDPVEFDRLLQWDRKVATGSLIGPYMVKAGTMVDGPEAIGRPHSINVATAIEGRAAVDLLKRKGADFVKVYSMLPREAYFAIAGEAKKQGLKFAGHVPFSVSAAEASDAGQKSMEHLFGVYTACSTREADLRDEAMSAIAKNGFADFVSAEIRAEIGAMETYSDKKASALLARFVRNGTWQVPTLVGWSNLTSPDETHFANDPRLKYVSPRKRNGWKAQRKALLGRFPGEFFPKRESLFQKQLEFVAAMRRAGVGLLAGTDTATLYVYPGFSLHDELALLVKAGLKPMEALQAATRNPADYFGLLESRGTVERGKIADLVLLEASPLDDITNTGKIEAVVLRGRLFSKTKLREMLEAVETSQREQ